MVMEVLFSGVPVADFAPAVRWYERLFGRAADIVVHDGEVMWRIAETGWVYVVEDAKRAGNALVTVSVSDLDGAVREVAARGITSAPIEVVGEAGRKARISDPEGNTISLIQVGSAEPT
jgi:predicted enzyme related to lactoylglutathione lyase